MQGKLIFVLALHLALTALPGIAAALVAARRGQRQVAVLLAAALAASGASALLAFWAYYGDRLLGESFSFLVPLGSAAAIGWALRGGLERSLLRQLATPLALWALGSAFLLFLGFLHGGADHPLAMAATRFSGASNSLPSDNDIPHFFSEWFFLHGHRGTPPLYPGGWLASDRPPLQVGYVLSQRPFGWDGGGLNYQVLCLGLQQLWIPGLWALLSAAGVGRTTRALAMVTVLVSGLAIVNGFFVWPKMLPAAMLLAAAALTITPLWHEVRGKLWAAALIGGLCALALLAHGGSIFGVIALVVVVAYRGLPSRRWLALALLVGVAAMAPWLAYQRFGDPPGNRLEKWTLAGVVKIDDRGVSQAIVDSYREAGFGGALHDKAENYVTMAGGGPMVEVLRSSFDSGNWREIVGGLREVIFLGLLPSLGLLLLAPLAMAAVRSPRGPPEEWRFALVCFAAVAGGALFWGLLVFGSETLRTVLHVGSYLLPVLAMAGAVAGLRASFPRFAIGWVGCWALLSLALYVPALQPLPGASYSLLDGALAGLALLGFALVASGVPWRGRVLQLLGDSRRLTVEGPD